MSLHDCPLPAPRSPLPGRLRVLADVDAFPALHRPDLQRPLWMSGDRAS